MKRIVVLILALTLITTVACKPTDEDLQVSDEFVTEEYNLDVEGGKIYGTLTLPKGEGPFTAAIIIQGSGPTDRDGNSGIAGKNNSLKMISEALAKENIASVRYDKRGIGESAGLVANEEDLVFEDYINDVILWVEKIREDNRFDKVVIIGHSEGALIGGAAANKTKVEGYVSVAGAGENVYHVLSRQLKAQSEEVFEMCLPIMEELRKGNLVADVPEGLYSLFRPSVQPYLISWFKYEPREVIAQMDLPILIVQGDTDLQITVEDAKALHEANPDSRLIIIKGMNHILKDAPIDQEENIATYSNPDLELNTEFKEELISFIKGL